MKNKIVVFFIFMLLISCFITNSVGSYDIISNQKKLDNRSIIDSDYNNRIIASIKTFDESQNRYVERPIRELSRYEAEKIKNGLIELQNAPISTEDRIKKQINIMHEWNVLPAEITYEEFEKILDNFKDIYDFNNQFLSLSLVPGVIVYGPAITSRLAFAGVLLPLHIPLWKFIKPWFSQTNYSFYNVFNGTQIMKWVGVAPVLVYYCSAMSLVNIFGLTLGLNTVFSPFMSIDILYAGFTLTINIWEDYHAVNMLDWGVGVSLTGITVYVENT